MLQIVYTCVATRCIGDDFTRPE